MVTYAYDSANQMICASPVGCGAPATSALRLTPDVYTGLIFSTQVSTVKTIYPRTQYGELASILTQRNNQTLAYFEYDSSAKPRDALGRITRTTEVVGGITRTRDYTYDLSGRLEQVKKDGSIYETYEYDDNGNRLAVTSAGGRRTATYDQRPSSLFCVWVWERWGRHGPHRDDADLERRKFHLPTER